MNEIFFTNGSARSAVGASSSRDDQHRRIETEEEVRSNDEVSRFGSDVLEAGIHLGREF